MKKAAKKNLIVFILAILIIGWGVLFFTGRGILVFSEERDGPIGSILECRYFTGIGFVTQKHLKTDIALLGHEVCPRIVDLD